ncbi:hypothetical protein Halru_0342 [Halovivax ruber XH-70]|uniref:DUF424 domain-containing protein n=1 Tax=Halovivax ruber (strain DSM 18193 / JCM 13892 / XH-70) TaxID=797302 RepID=L0I9R7_HALRX|nr:DUF424 domain-containing protein [Halovivax ruber]AGB14986.1 hypothetical protein Halru_0342 [Halovivax ruber XH-70]
MTGENGATSEDGADTPVVCTKRETPEGTLVAVCDADILGETFEDGAVSLTVTEDFYGTEPVEPAAARDALVRADVANIVGHEAVELAIEVGIVDEANVLDVGATVHAQSVRM